MLLVLSQRVKMAVDNLFVTAGLSIRAATPGEPLLYKKHLLANILFIIRLLSSPDLLQIGYSYCGPLILLHTFQSTQDGHWKK